jgi:hypothetical protein
MKNEELIMTDLLNHKDFQIAASNFMFDGQLFFQQGKEIAFAWLYPAG